MMPLPTIAEEWENLERAVIPPAAGPNQRREMQRAFYAGAAVMFNLLRVTADMEEEAAGALIAAWRGEVESFALLQVRGAGEPTAGGH